MVFAPSSLFISHHSLGAEVNHFCISLVQPLPPLWYSVARNSEILVFCVCPIPTSKERGMNVKLHQHWKITRMFISNSILRHMFDNLKKHISFSNDLIPLREKRKLLINASVEYLCVLGTRAIKLRVFTFKGLMFRWNTQTKKYYGMPSCTFAQDISAFKWPVSIAWWKHREFLYHGSAHFLLGLYWF